MATQNPADATDPAQAPQYDGKAAEWYAASARPWLEAQWAALTTLLPETLNGGVAVDIGAGVGAMLKALQQAGAAHIYAVEPSPWMRTGMMTHVAFAPELAPITTVIPGALADAEPHLPQHWDVALLMNVHGHLSVEAENHIWKTVTNRLKPGGRFVLGLQPPATATAVPHTTYDDCAIGTRTWKMAGHATVVDDHHVRWVTERTLTDHTGQTLDSHTTDCLWRVSSPEDMLATAKTHGLEHVSTHDEMQMYAFTKP